MMLDKKTFWKTCHPYLEEKLAKWGFRAETQGQFVREHAQHWDGIEVGLLRGDRDFRVLIGIHIPALYEFSKFIDQWEHRTFEISHFLGMYRENGTLGAHQGFPFVNKGELLERLEQRVVPRLEAWALPWYERFHDLADVVQEFYERRVRDHPSKRLGDPGLNPSDAFGWALYGWMLEELGRKDEAIPWLKCAYAEVTRPLFIDQAGRFVEQGTKGARPYRHPEAEERLEELLRQSLKLSLP